MKTKSKVLLPLAVVLSLGLVPATASADEGALTCDDVISHAQQGSGYGRAIILKTEHDKTYISNMSEKTEVLDSGKNSVTVRVPVTFFDRNKDGEFQADEHEVVVPGAKSQGSLHICNNGPTDKAILNVKIINASSGGEVADLNDPFYSELTVNGKPFASYVGKDTPIISNKTVGKGEENTVSIDYEFPVESTSGNKAGYSAEQPSGEPNDYEKGSRVATLDVKIDMQGIDPDKPTKQNDGSLAKTGVNQTSALIASGMLVTAGGALALIGNRKRKAQK